MDRSLRVFVDATNKVKKNGMASRDKIQQIKTIIKKLDMDKYAAHSIDEISNAIIEVVSEFDNIVALFGIYDSRQLQIEAKLNPVIERTYIFLDSKYRDFSANTDGLYNNRYDIRWALSDLYIADKAFTSHKNELKNIIGIRLYQSFFTIPRFIFDAKASRITILFKEFSSQAYQNVDRRYHFCLPYIPYNMQFPDELNDTYEGIANSNYLIRTENYESEFRFNKPFKNLQTLTVNFGMTYEMMQFPPVELLVRVVDDGKGSYVFEAVETDHLLHSKDPNIIIFGDGDPFTYKQTFVFKSDDYTTSDPVADQAFINAIRTGVSMVAIPNRRLRPIYSGWDSNLLTDRTFKLKHVNYPMRLLMPLEIISLNDD